MAFVPSNLPEQRVYQDHVFPLTLTWTQSESENVCPMDWLQINASNVDSLLRKHRAILFRCSNLVRTHEEFDKIIEALNYNCMDYVGGAAVRTQLTSRVFTANESPSSENIPFHHEMAQTPDPPTHLFFFCEVPPTQGGATPILISSEVCERMQKLHPVFMDELDKCGVRYVRVMSEYDDPTSAIGRGWRSTFQCTDRDGAECALKALGSSWEWLPDGSLKTVTSTVPALRVDDQPATAERSGQKTFFNSLVAAHTGWNDSRNVGERAVVLGEGIGGESSGATTNTISSSSSSSRRRRRRCGFWTQTQLPVQW
eukprot:CAMPEP_0170399690 /NCGR_PEP_ID=MMETSP0117_2-20130122/24098_1 /TAXON_ID=400756 /ORGANISM="Durinskia baltica, Strain CSIRO CS-38" /LENGTH=312 /DNA_ID=CAMNT_0010656387 /DNA_START=119 /DNA_END=1054 /DNA_ORIENTATION=+